MFYNKYLEKTRNAMEKSTHKYEQIMNYVLSPFGYYSASLNHEKDIVLNNKNKLQDNFNKQSNYYRNRYPKYPNRVRFTKE